MSETQLSSRLSAELGRHPTVSHGEQVLVLAIVLAAFGLRVARLDTQSLWGDEMFSVYRAGQALGEITRAVPDERTLPPLYYYLLHLWVPLAGKTETAVRFPSVGFGVLAVALLYVLVRWTLGPRVAVVAAFLATLSPFWIYYAQETRVYALETALLVLALYLLARASLELDPGVSWRLWAGYTLAAALTLYSFYFAAFGLGAGVLWVVVQRRSWPDVARRCLTAQLAVLLLFAPLLVLAGPRIFALSSQITPANTTLSTIFQHLEVAFTFGTTIELARVWPFVIIGLVLAGLGLIGVPGRFALLWGLLLVAPVLGIYFVSFVPQSGWERYFLPSTPAWFALVAAGLNGVGSAIGAPSGRIGPETSRFGRNMWDRLTLARWGLAILAFGGLVYGMALSLDDYYFDSTYWRHDFRSSVRQVDDIATPDVAAIVNGPPQFPSFFYYFRGKIPATELPHSGEDALQTIAHLSELSAKYRGLWFVKYNPPDFDYGGVIERWLDEHTYRATLRWVENITFGLYLTEDPSTPRIVGASPVDRTFASDAQLVRYRATTARSQKVEYLLVTLTWRALRSSPPSLLVFAHLLDRNGQLIAQSDHEPVANQRPAQTWKTGDVLDDRFALQLPEASQRSGMSLVVGLYHPDGTRLPIQGLAPSENSLSFPLTDVP